MSFYVKTGSFVDNFSESGFLLGREHWQHLGDSLAETQQLREVSDTQAVITSLGRITGGAGEAKVVASIDRKLLMYLWGLDPDFFQKEKFHAWLQKHQEWKVA